MDFHTGIKSYFAGKKLNSLIKDQKVMLMKSFFEGITPSPRIIHLETRTRCNSTCSFCMANIHDDPREDLLMPDSLLNKIFFELNKWDYSNRISFYNNNEPFLDKRLSNIIKNARENLPKAYLEIKSNGRGLKIEHILKVFNEGLDMLYINDYTSDGKHSKNVIKIMNELSSIRRFKGHMVSNDGNYYRRIVIYHREIDEVLQTRGGSAPNRKELEKSLKSSCFRPFEMMTVSPEGRVGVCSNDFFYATNMGDVNLESIDEIWNSKKYRNFREKLMEGERDFHNTCSKCDYGGFSYEMLKEYNILK